MAHLTSEERHTISSLKKSGYKQIEIAKIINRDKSVISRELKRNEDQRNGVYKADLANRKYKSRLKEKPKHIRFTTKIQERVIQLIREDYSPEQISGWLKKQGESTVSPERIYQFIWDDKKSNGTLYKHLRRKGRKYSKRSNSKDNRGIIKNRVSIEKRPKIVEKRERFGDLEVDLIIGGKQAILTINDRASGMIKMSKVESKEAHVINQTMTSLLEEWKPYIYTITADNGKEFAGHEFIAEQLNIDYYFARPYHSWERGSNENLNGLVRQYFEKGMDFKYITDEQIKQVEEKLNLRPRKRFGYENPIFVMDQLLFNQKVAFVT